MLKQLVYRRHEEEENAKFSCCTPQPSPATLWLRYWADTIDLPLIKVIIALVNETAESQDRKECLYLSHAGEIYIITATTLCKEKENLD